MDAKNYFPNNCYVDFKDTRGHARFARIPLVIRLGDSRIRMEDSGYGVPLYVIRYKWQSNTQKLTYFESSQNSEYVNYPMIPDRSPIFPKNSNTFAIFVSGKSPCSKVTENINHIII